MKEVIIEILKKINNRIDFWLWHHSYQIDTQLKRIRNFIKLRMKVGLVVFLFISALSHAGRISAGTGGDADYYWVIICVISLITLFVWWMNNCDDGGWDY